MEHHSFPERLNDHLNERDYPDHTIQAIGRMCRHSLMSEQSALALLEEAENGRRHADGQRSGAITALPMNWEGISPSELSRVDL